jgi:hypothetical protein
MVSVDVKRDSSPGEAGSQNRAMPCIAAIASIALVLWLAHASPSRADIWPRVFGRSSVASDDDPAKRTRIGISGGWLFPLAPVAFEYWRPDFGLGFTVIGPVSPMFDVVMEADVHSLRFDRDHFEEDFGATPLFPVSRASVGPLMILGRIHRIDEGLRPYGDFGIGIMDVSRPGVAYLDSTGAHSELQGAEIFGLDFCYSLGVGMEYIDLERWLGGFVDARLIWAPATSYPTHAVFTARSGILIRLPRWRF